MVPRTRMLFHQLVQFFHHHMSSEQSSSKFTSLSILITFLILLPIMMQMPSSVLLREEDQLDYIICKELDTLATFKNQQLAEMVKIKEQIQRQERNSPK
jgi:hypothetical protein